MKSDNFANYRVALLAALLVILSIGLALTRFGPADASVVEHSATERVAQAFDGAGDHTRARVDAPSTDADNLRASANGAGPIGGTEIAVLSLLGVGLIVLSLVTTVGRH